MVHFLPNVPLIGQCPWVDCLVQSLTLLSLAVLAYWMPICPALFSSEESMPLPFLMPLWFGFQESGTQSTQFLWLEVSLAMST